MTSSAVTDPSSDSTADTLLALHAAGIEAVGGRQATRRALDDIDAGPRVRVAAIGKAASAMALGAREALGDTLLSALVLTKHDHLEPELVADPRVDCRESAHPVPDASSLEAGASLIRFVRSVADDEHLLVLVSGGASSLVEHLVDGLTLDELRRRTDGLLAEGAAIGEINRVRRTLSTIKGGGMLAHLGGCRATQLLISDVPGDHPGDIGSGPFVAPGTSRVDTRLIASSAIAQAAVVAEAERRGLTVVQRSGSLDGDVERTGERIAAHLLDPDVAAGVHVWGGEPTVVLPADPGRGGRNQHLALSLAVAVAGRDDLAVLVAATDGSDGPTSDAGGLVDGTTLARGGESSAREALARADAGSWLERNGALVTTGPTGTNVMDLAIALVGPSPVS